MSRAYGAVDVHYPEPGGATAALVVADDIHFGHVVGERTCRLEAAGPYQPGRFYQRELPAILAVLATTGPPDPLPPDLLPLDLLVVDGYVDLDPAGRPGLGAHVHARTGLPVVGVAKTAFRTATQAVPVRRGRATRPLYVTAAGLPVERAATIVAGMAGPHRLPDALRRVDALARRL